MFPDPRIREAVSTMIAEVSAPPVPWASIQQRIAQPQPTERKAPAYLRFAIAASLVLATMSFVFPAVSQAVIQSIEARYRAALHAMGGYAPPPPPTTFVASLSPTVTTLADARSRVPFALVEPVGLPNDIASQKIETSVEGRYSGDTHTWRKGSTFVSFAYRRTDGRGFMINASRFDASEMPSKYRFEAMDPTPTGKPVLVKRENFAWRNGDQIMSVSEGDGISAAEIDAIRIAMHGNALTLRQGHARNSGGFLRVINP